MIAQVAGELVAEYIERRWPSDKEEVYKILRLGINKAWSEGKWSGMTKEMFVNVYKDEYGKNYIIGPDTHPILLALNVNGYPRTIRDNYFMFHKNGNGDVKNRPDCHWNEDVYDLGEMPYFNKDNIIFSEGVRIGVRATGKPGAGEKVYIAGSYDNGLQVVTYKKTDTAKCCGCTVDTNTVDTVTGAEIEIGEGFTYINNIIFNDITAISKTVTRTPIEIIAIDKNGNGSLISRMNPNQRFSSYRKYMVPTHLCGRTCLHGIFKISKQEKITSDTDNIIISNEEVLIGLAKSIHNIYNKEQQEIGASYFLQAISTLDKDKREEESPSESPLQVESIYGDDLGILKHYQ